jgi:hypothetical protein
MNVYFCKGLSRNDLWRPTCHDYIERNEKSMPCIQKNGLEGSGRHQNKAKDERSQRQGTQAGRPPPLLDQSGAVSWIML